MPRRLLSAAAHPLAGGAKLDADARDDFILNLLMCLLCTVNLKPLRVSKQSVASAALLWLGKMTSCFVNCRDGDTCILMADFWMFLHFDRRRMNNFSTLCGAARVKIRLWALTLLRGGRRRRICAMQIICRIFIYIYIFINARDNPAVRGRLLNMFYSSASLCSDPGGPNANARAAFYQRCARD